MASMALTTSIGREVGVNRKCSLHRSVGHDLRHNLLHAATHRVRRCTVVQVILETFGIAVLAHLGALWRLCLAGAIWIGTGLVVVAVGEGVWLTARVTAVLAPCDQSVPPEVFPVLSIAGEALKRNKERGAR